jgi:hypothetical protein
MRRGIERVTKTAGEVLNREDLCDVTQPSECRTKVEVRTINLTRGSKLSVAGPRCSPPGLAVVRERA